MPRKPIITASLENYLKAIHHLETQERVARAKDIAHLMSVSRASVTGALKSLSQKGLIDYSPYSFITLTESGRSLALDLLNRHQALHDFFIGVLKMDPEAADKLACKLEHVITGEVVDKIASLRDFMAACPRGETCLASFESNGSPGPMAEVCPAMQPDAFCSSCQSGLWTKAGEQ